MAAKIKYGLFILVLAIFCMPWVQDKCPVFSTKPLNGYAKSADDVPFTWKGWWDGTYQENKNKYLNDNSAFKPDLIRLNNQIDYSLYNALHAFRIVEGGDHNLFVSSNTIAYFGTDYIGYTAIRTKMEKLKALSDTFAKLGKSLVFVHSPAKEFMYPEYIPTSLITKKTTTNLETYLRVADSLQIPQINFNGWFCSMKNTSTEKLFSKQGVHWSVYGSYLAADSLIRYIEHQRSIHMPHPVWTKVTHSDKPRQTDNDVEQTLNLIYPFTQEMLSYPEVTYPQDATMTKPKVVYIGDSFLLIWITDGIMDHTNSNWEVWQWFAQVWDKNSTADKPSALIDNHDWLRVIDQSDCIVLMYTAFNLPYAGNGFIEKAYDHYFPGKK